MADTATTNDFFILGPALVRGNRVLEAVQALYYLPDNFKLIFNENQPVDKQMYLEVLSLAHRNELAERVQFSHQAQQPESEAVIASSRPAASAMAPVVSGDTPEALASAILNVARAA